MKKQHLKPLLTYCGNVHPLHDAARWDETVARFAARMGELTGKTPFPMGLWFHEGVLAAYAPLAAGALRGRLQGYGATTFTLNAFPQGDFHQPVVKLAVYRPDWTDPARAAYVRGCATLLADLLPDGEDYGSVSTLPLGWREGWTPEHDAAAARHLVETACFLAGLKARTGKHVALALEPEPGCVLERTPQVLAYWNDVLRPAARAAGASAVQAVEEHLGVCYDTCHQAVQFEDAVEALGALAGAGIAVRKMQLSNALEFPADPGDALLAVRERFVEPKYLHQVRVKTPDGIFEIDDLPAALAAGPGLRAHPWRVHYHVPVHAETLFDGAVRTTRPEMLKALRHALDRGLCRHFEVETYTWSVLPEEHRPQDDESLARALAKELDSVKAEVPGVFD